MKDQLQYDVAIIERIKNKLIKQKQTVSTAESVTSGHLQVCFSLADQSSLFFQGGITTYNTIQKCRHLNVDVSDAVAANCVSEEVSAQMAEEACNFFSTTWQ